ncbi:response regulator transcription factor [Rhodoferax sp. GW822-FHT02A01]|uniref:response regulator transcription factor n=1 Tax=Rhodoferax sp. GW822-FHT02A01 TaxID=3141537 RepID=UPI00315C8896
MKILLLEDHPIVRIGLHQLVAKRWPEALMQEAPSLATALELVREQVFDAAIVDLNLPDAKGLESVSRLRRAAPQLHLLVLSLNDEVAYASHVLQLGALGYLTKDRAADELVVALERVMAGGRYVTATQADHLLDLVSGRATILPHEELSAQEYRVMLLLSQDMRLTEIGELMHLSPKTVSTYRSRILEKLALANNGELIRYCLDHGIAL